MKKVQIKVAYTGKAFAIQIDNRFFKWLFYKIYEVQVRTQRLDEEPSAHPGRVTRTSTPPEHVIDRPVKGGRLVKALPRQVRKMQAAQKAK